MEFQLQNVFQIHELKKYITNDGKIDFPNQDVWVTIVGLSLSHSRAILSQQLAGTILQDSLLPILDAREVTANFFPNLNINSYLAPS